MVEDGQRDRRVLGDLCHLLDPEAIVVGGELAASGEPRLEAIRATIRQPLDTMTSVAADLLVRRLGNGAGKPEHIVCATTFVRRASA